MSIRLRSLLVGIIACTLGLALHAPAQAVDENTGPAVGSARSQFNQSPADSTLEQLMLRFANCAAWKNYKFGVVGSDIDCSNSYSSNQFDSTYAPQPKEVFYIFDQVGSNGGCPSHATRYVKCFFLSSGSTQIAMTVYGADRNYTYYGVDWSFR
ncbi:hypothetical protein [Williamsia sp. CHRR-6]|uniref:hypothetical protein n=1 Tax=Williamsia sp. CHRR-6 TaxID=2835871 RepID=UPI001BDB021A|nr:hypothetical protein [Williamsia sp. CHRR-6]MBT0565944.1 hypothetical protein [Williamsia sp. CHRR-6]